jgi:hypothetical protein
MQIAGEPCDLPSFTNCNTTIGNPSTQGPKPFLNSSTSLPENSHKKDFLKKSSPSQYFTSEFIKKIAKYYTSNNQPLIIKLKSYRFFNGSIREKILVVINRSNHTNNI